MTKEELKHLADLSDQVIKLKAKIIKIRSELLASTLCNDFEVLRIFGENENLNEAETPQRLRL